MSHKLVSVVDEHGALYAYSNATKNFKKVEGHNVFDYLGLSAGAAGHELRSARSLKFLSEVDLPTMTQKTVIGASLRLWPMAVNGDSIKMTWTLFLTEITTDRERRNIM